MKALKAKDAEMQLQRKLWERQLKGHLTETRPERGRARSGKVDPDPEDRAVPAV